MSRETPSGPRGAFDIADPLEDVEISDEWKRFILRMQTLSRRKFVTVVAWFSREGDPIYYRVMGKKESV